MKKTLFVFLGLALIVGLVGCASSGATHTVNAKPTPTTDTASFVPAVGFVDALYNNLPAYLYAGPGDSYTVLGQLLVGQNAQLLGIDSTGNWFLIKINGITAWVSSARVSATIAQ